MLSRLTRPVAAATATLFALAVLSACGDDSPEEETAEGFDAVEVSGPVGELPEFEWKAMLASGETQTEVLEEGDGAEIVEGDQVLANLAVSTDFDEQIALETYGEDRTAALITVGEEAAPQAAFDLLTALVAEQVEPGMTLGTRLALTVDVKEEWGDTGLFLGELGIGNEDGIVVVADLEATTLDGPQGAKKAAPAWAPRVVSTDGVPTGLSSAGIPKPDVKGKEIRSAVVIQGTGPKVEKGDLAIVDYLGQTWGGEQPFDESYSKKKQPLKVNVGGAEGPGIPVIEGWSDGLVGVPVGSRILIEIPPAKGYGKQGQGKDIKGDDILYFVVDVLAAA
ncbi:FKBP-type peptidyl-prolyl cis-trans isomerase [Nocardioides antri]|uniref:peptidylprolyl isomerase n=1 Tax=Nocardioides antri TaxID=2607659 RepID=A0A5B1M8H0_9ACTN|nr:FKBP-type peptidyl-prolyl cis-trans isomerase [Nocardioides antri]KAA1429352.1 FKBP-type peptidyl-prolyl cis-trans isomerase [Nocardioides antri]